MAPEAAARTSAAGRPGLLGAVGHPDRPGPALAGRARPPGPPRPGRPDPPGPGPPTRRARVARWSGTSRSDIFSGLVSRRAGLSRGGLAQITGVNWGVRISRYD